MFTSQKSSGGGYTTTVAYLAVAFIFSPAVFVISRPVSYFTASLAISISAICLALAWMNWRKAAQPSVPSIASRRSAAK